MIAMIRLAWRLVRRHLDLYAGVIVTVVLTMLIGGAEVTLASDFSDPSRVNVPGVSADELAVQLDNVSWILWFIAILAVTICGFMLISIVTQVVSYRQRELAMMRLAGATRRRLGWLMFLECFFVSLVAGVPSVIVGALLAPAFLRGLQAIKFFGPNVSVRTGVSVRPLLILLVVMALLAGLAGRRALRRIPDRELVDSHDNTVSSMSKWSVTLRLVIGVGGILAIIFLDPQTLGAWGMLALPFLAIIPAIALAPLLVPAGAWLVGHLVGLVAPGSGLLAAKRSSKDRLRYARLATPVIVGVGMIGGFMVANVPDEQVQAANFRKAAQSQTVSEAIGLDQTDRAAQAWSRHGGKVARFAILPRLDDSCSFADVKTMEKLTGLKIISGDASKVHGTDVTAPAKDYNVGDTMDVTDAQGHKLTAHVVATYTHPFLETPIMSWDQVGRFAKEPDKLHTTTYLDSLDASAAEQVASSSGASVTPMSKEQWVSNAIAERKANSYQGNVGIFGTVYVMCLVSVIQMAVSGAMARHREFHVLHSLGIGMRRLLNVVGTETLIVQLAAGVLIALSITALGIEFATTNGTSAGSALAEVAPLSLETFGSIVLLTLIAQLGGAWVVGSRARNPE